MKRKTVFRILLVVLIAALLAGICLIVLRDRNHKTPVHWDDFAPDSTSALPPDEGTAQDVHTQSTTLTAPDTSVQNQMTVAPPVTNPETGRIIVNVTDDNWKLVVVNSTREFPESYSPQLDEIFSTGKFLDARVTPYYEEMYNAAQADGLTLTPFSAYRSYERQKNNFNDRIQMHMNEGLSREEATKKAATVILPPGTSEHNLGLCMDICNVYDSFATQPEYAWLCENAHRYGFILRYPEGKEDKTGVVFEPWHWRFVGAENAKQIRDSGLCLEEYLDANGIAY